jgi:hypothetical protein
MTFAHPLAQSLITTYSQHAEGTFKARTIAGTPHCGRIDGDATFAYTVDIPFRLGCDVLDTSGFLLDNLDFQNYFDSLPAISVSCEQLARQAAHHFCLALGDRASMVEYISVRIHPFAGVWVEGRVHPVHPKTCHYSEVQA